MSIKKMKLIKKTNFSMLKKVLLKISITFHLMTRLSLKCMKTIKQQNKTLMPLFSHISYNEVDIVVSKK